MRIPIPDQPPVVIPDRILVAVAVGILLAVSLFSAFYTVGPEEEGVVLRFGRHLETTGSGLHFKLPLGIDRVHKVPVATVDVEEFGYRSASGEGGDGALIRKGFERESSMLTGDLNIVQVGWDVQYRRADPENLLFEVQDPIDTLRDIAQSVMRQVIGDRASIQVLTVERAEIQEEAKVEIQRTVRDLQMGLQIVEVNLLFVNPPDEVLASFHDLNKAEQDAQRFYEEASREYEERVNRAHGLAARMIQEAEGYASRRRNVATGEADRFTAVLTEYRKAPEVTRRRLYLEALEQTLPGVKEIVVTGHGGTSPALPVLDLRAAAARHAAPAQEGAQR